VAAKRHAIKPGAASCATRLLILDEPPVPWTSQAERLCSMAIEHLTARTVL